MLLVEDDERLSGLLAGGFRTQGYAVDPAGTFEDARWLATEIPYDLAIVDVGLPDGDGVQLCEELRAQARWVPILILTARGSVRDRVRALDGGADDYVVKPFSFAELSARARALLRRGAPERPARLQVGALVLDPASHQASVGGAGLSLSPREFSLLELFLRHPGKVLARSEIREHLWDWAAETESNVIDVYVGYLRARLRAHSGAPVIETVRGAGYRLVPVPA